MGDVDSAARERIGRCSRCAPFAEFHAANRAGVGAEPVRSAQEIAAGMRQRPTGSEEGLVGYYPFEDQGTAQTADLSSRGLTATLTGNSVYEPSSALCLPAQVPGASAP
jgi:hypothetical protein